MAKKKIPSKNKLPEDVDVLSHLYDLGHINYVDISRQQQIKKIIRKWPLLDELLKQGL